MRACPSYEYHGCKLEGCVCCAVLKRSSAWKEACVAIVAAQTLSASCLGVFTFHVECLPHFARLPQQWGAEASVASPSGAETRRVVAGDDRAVSERMSAQAASSHTGIIHSQPLEAGQPSVSQ